MSTLGNPMLEFYQYPNCSTCRKAAQWLAAHDVAVRSIHIVDEPPSVAKLKRALKLSGKPLAKLFNTSGQAYREGKLKERLPTLSEADALRLLSENGKLIKRPLLIGDDRALIGFQASEYEAALKE